MIVVLDTNIVASATGAESRLTARVDYLVTGDKGHLLALKAAVGIPIVTVSHFLRLIGVPENPT